jgi:hypothetical protein
MTRERLYDCWKETILSMLQGTQRELGPIEPPESTPRTELGNKLVELRFTITLSKTREFWRTTLPDLVDQVRDLLCGEEAWALWLVRHLSVLSAELRP